MVCSSLNIKINSGFTLIELIIVIIILGALVSIAPVFINNYLSSQDLITSAEKLSSSIKYAQINSANSYPSKLILNQSNNEYYIYTQNFSDTIKFPNSLSFTSASDSFVFDNKGIADYIDDKMITLTNNAQIINIIIKKITGAVEVIH